MWLNQKTNAVRPNAQAVATGSSRRLESPGVCISPGGWGPVRLGWATFSIPQVPRLSARARKCPPPPFRSCPLPFALCSHERRRVPVRADGCPGGGRPGSAFASGVPRRPRGAGGGGGAQEAAPGGAEGGRRAPSALGRAAGQIHPPGPERYQCRLPIPRFCPCALLPVLTLSGVWLVEMVNPSGGNTAVS